MNSQRSSNKERIGEERQKLNQICIQLYLAAQEKEDESELARIVRGLEVATAELKEHWQSCRCATHFPRCLSVQTVPATAPLAPILPRAWALN